MFRTPYFTKAYFGSEYWVVQTEDEALPVTVEDFYPTRLDRVKTPNPAEVVKVDRTDRTKAPVVEPVLAASTDRIKVGGVDTVDSDVTDRKKKTTTEVARSEATSRSKSETTSSGKSGVTSRVKRKVVD